MTNICWEPVFQPPLKNNPKEQNASTDNSAANQRAERLKPVSSRPQEATQEAGEGLDRKLAQCALSACERREEQQFNTKPKD